MMTDEARKMMTDAARELAWTLYLLRTEQLISEQHGPWSQGHPVGGLHLSAPSEKSVTHMARFLETAYVMGQKAVISDALDPLIDAIDAIDNTRPRHPALKDCRAGLQKAYDALHVLKERSDT